MNRLLISSACLLIAFSELAIGYDPLTHERLSIAVVNASVLNKDNKTLANLGLEPIGNGQTFSINGFDRKTIIQHIRDGSRFEDNGIRAINHFFDPQHDRGLFGSNYRSPDWALEDNSDIDEQISSLKDARRNFYLALTAAAADERERRFGLTFEKLGQVIHHVQDMAQPQHTRDDQHLDFPFVKLPGLERPSRYERYTAFIQREPVFEDLLAHEAYLRVKFPRARDFWQTKDKAPQEGKGIAEFTNANFVSAGKNFTASVQGSSIVLQPHPEYPNPVWDQQTLEEIPLRTLLQDPNCPGPGASAEVAELDGILTFLGTKVTDRYGNTEAVNARASTLSIFDQDLELYGQTVSYPRADGGSYETSQVFSLNRFNFCSTYPFLIPKAVAYSAGLIDHFFRGRLEGEDVEFTASGLRLRVRNAIDPQKTPEWKDEVLYAHASSGSSGSLVLAYEYKDGNGEIRYGNSPAVPLVEDVAPGATSSVRYDFAVSVPEEGREVKYRLVFRGRLGQEEDAVAVGLADGGSGFIVTPNYVPVDGVPAPRLITNIDGQWKLSRVAGMEAGNIDWKGRFRNGRPTRVLTWWGPRSRYFFGGDFRRQIYMGDRIFAVAPATVYGAAATTDTSGKEWLLAVTRQNGITVFRRPFTRSDSAELYDPVTSPDGWQEVGVFSSPYVTGGTSPWFFNASGTEAQAMVIRQKFVGIVNRIPQFEYDGLARWKIEVDINAPSAVRHDLGNLDGVQYNYNLQIKHIPICDGPYHPTWTFPGYEIRSTSRSGRYIVAVDYKNDQEVLAVLSDNRVDTFELRADGSCSQRVVEKMVESTGELRLEVGDQHVIIEKNEWHETGHESRTRIGHRRYEGQVQREIERSSVEGRIHFIDLRYDLVVIDKRSTASSGSLAAPFSDSSPRTTISESATRLYEIRSDVLNKEILSTEGPGSEYVLGLFPDDLVDREYVGGGAGFSDSESEIQKPNVNMPSLRWLVSPGEHDWWVVDGSSRVAGSQYTDLEEVFIHLSDGDLPSLVPSGPQNAIYDPLFVVK